MNPCHTPSQACCCTMLHHASLQPSRFFRTLAACMEEFYSVMTPREVLHLYASCREAHDLTVADAVAAAHFAISRWYHRDASLCVWRSIWQQCVVAAQARGWTPTVWEHAELLIQGFLSLQRLQGRCRFTEFPGWSDFPSSERDFEEHWVALPHARKWVVDGLESYLAWKTNLQRKVRGILALFLYYHPPGFSWSFMLALDDNSFAAVQVGMDEDFRRRGLDCQIADKICALDNWRIDAGGRVLMLLKRDFELPDPVDKAYVRLLEYVIIQSTCRKGTYRRRARNGVGYTWNEFLRYYADPKLACERWCEAAHIEIPNERWEDARLATLYRFHLTRWPSTGDFLEVFR